MPPIPTLATSRLRLIPLNADHAEALFDIFRDPETLTYWHTLPHQTPDETRAMIAQTLAGGSPWWVMTHTGSERVSGLAGFFLGAFAPGFGYIVHREYWRQGYGSEAVRALVGYGFETLGLSRIELWIHADNLASRRLAESVGFRQRGQFMQSAPHLGRYETLVYGLRAAEWPDTPLASRDIAFSGIYPILPTPDVAGTVAFYRDLLGFQVSYFTPQYAIVARGEWTSERAELHFVYEARPPAPAAALRLPVGPDVSALYDEFQRRGVTLATPILAKPWGREFEVIDPNGWRLVFAGVI